MSLPALASGYKGNYGPAGANINKPKIPGYNVGQLPQFTPDQMSLFKGLFGAQPGIEAGIGQLSKLASGDESMFGQLEAPAYTSFNRLLGQIGSRFSGQGMGGQRSSAFQNAVSGAAGDLAQGLQSRRLALQQQAIAELLGLGENLLGQRPYQNVLTEKSPGFWRSLIGGLGEGAGALSKGIGGYLGGGF